MLLIISQRLQEHQKLPAVSDDKHKIPADNRRAATVHIFAQLIVKFPADKPTNTNSSNHHMSAVGMCFHVWWTETSVRCTSLLKLSSPRLCLVSNQSASPSQIVSHPSDVCSLQAGSTSCSSVSLWTSSSLSWPNLASSTHSPFTYSIELNIMNPLLRNNRKKRSRCILLQAAVPSCHSAEILPRLSL